MKFIGKIRNKDDYESIVALRDEYRRILGLLTNALCRVVMIRRRILVL